MGTTQTSAAFEYLRHLAGEQTLRDLPDRELLRRFAAQHDESAFEMLLRRHGPMVLRTCQRLLHDRQDAEDAFQAAFLVLARKAGSMRWRTSVGPWLHEVAHRLALELRTRNRRRQAREAAASRPCSQGNPLAEITAREFLAVLDEELRRLPEKYRAPMVLCCLEGNSGEEAARRLGWSLSTLRRRLAAGRELLHHRLCRRGIMLPTAVLSAALLTEGVAPAARAALAGSTAKAALQLAVGRSLDGTVSAQCIALVDGVMRNMIATKVKWASALIVCLGLLSAGAGVIVHRVVATPAQETAEPAAKEAVPPEPRPATAESDQDAEPPRRISLAGRVVDSAGRPVGGAAIHLRERPQSWSSGSWPTSTRNAARTASGADGHFRFQDVALPKTGRFRHDNTSLDLIAVATSYGVAWKRLDAPLSDKPLQLVLPSQGRIQGRLVDQKGQPVQGAKVKVAEIAQLDHEMRPPLHAPGYLELRWSDVLLEAVTDADGRFSLSGVPKETRATLAVADRRFLRKQFYAATTDKPRAVLTDYPVFVGEPRDPAPVHTRFFTEVLEPGFTVRARVVFADTGKPALGALWAEPPISWPPNRNVDGEGRIVLEQLKAGTHNVWVYPPPESEYLGTVFPIELAGEPREVEQIIRLPRGVAVAGQVVDEETGRGIARVEVRHLSSLEKDRPAPLPVVPEVRSGQDGRFRLIVPPGKGKVVIAGEVEGYATPMGIYSYNDIKDPRFLRSLDIQPGRPPNELKFSLNPGLVAVCRVLDPGGKPVGGARVQIRCTTRYDDGGVWTRSRTTQTTDAAGEFRLSGFSANEQVAVLVTEPKRRLAAAEFVLSFPQAGNKPVPQTIELRPMTALEGRVLDERKKPLAGALVRLHREDANLGPWWSDQPPVTTDENGEFLFDALVPGMRYSVTVRAQGFAEASSRPFEAQAGRRRLLSDVRLVKADDVLAGVLLDSAGKPVAGARLEARFRAEPRDGWGHTFDSTPHLSDVEGRFRLTELPRDEVELRITLPGSTQAIDQGRHQTGQENLRIVLDVQGP